MAGITKLDIRLRAFAKRELSEDVKVLASIVHDVVRECERLEKVAKDAQADAKAAKRK